MILVPADSPGFSYTPVHTVAGVGTSATYYEDVRVPKENLVGELNGGWALMTNQLNHERVALTSAAPVTHSIGLVTEWAQQTRNPDGCRVIDSEWVQVLLGRAHARADMLKLLNWQLASATKDLSPADASATKVYGSEMATEVYRSLMEVVGPKALVSGDSPGAVLRGRLERFYRSSLVMTFGGGTNEIQRDIIGYVGLGLPAPRSDRDRHGLRTDPRGRPRQRSWPPRSSRTSAPPSGCRAVDAEDGRFDHELWAASATRPAGAHGPRGARRQRPRPARALQRARRGGPHGGAGAAGDARRHRPGPGRVRQHCAAGSVAAGRRARRDRAHHCALRGPAVLPRRAGHPRRERRRQLAAHRQQGRGPRRDAGRPVRRTGRDGAGADRLPGARRRPRRARRTPAAE